MTTGQIATKLGVDIHGAQRMDSDDFGVFAIGLNMFNNIFHAKLSLKNDVKILQIFMFPIR